MPSIYIDGTLPNHTQLEAYFKEKGFVPAESTVAAVQLRYAHNPAQGMKLTPFDEFNKTENKPKTVFLLWYSWANHYARLAAYFHPKQYGGGKANLDLFNKAYCRHIRLPATNEEIEIAVNELLK